MRLIASALAALAFVQQHGTHLTLAGAQYRFGGANIEWLAIEGYGPADPRGPRYPTRAEVNSALDDAKKMGVTVVRSQTLVDSVGCATCIEPTLGQFNESAFASSDYAIAAARARGIRLIATIIGDDAQTGGGGCVYLTWRSISVPGCSLSNMPPFWTDPNVIADVEQHIDVVLDHVNPLTHLAYKDDPTILGWDLLNGGGSPPGWTATIANHIRGIDARHLILSDASNARLRNVNACVTFVYTHWHEGPATLWPKVATCRKAGKPFIAYEYGWDRTNFSTVAGLRSFLAELQRNPEVAGDAFWALVAKGQPIPADVTDPARAAIDESGEWWALYYGGRTTLVNTAADMRARTQVITTHARAMRGIR